VWRAYRVLLVWAGWLESIIIEGVIVDDQAKLGGQVEKVGRLQASTVVLSVGIHPYRCQYLRRFADLGVTGLSLTNVVTSSGRGNRVILHVDAKQVTLEPLEEME
jgi:hypothetical protein